MKLNLLVLRTKDIELLKSQYALLGFNFEYHRHGNGPMHFSAETDGFVLEIYPLIKSMEKADNSLRLGFSVKNLNQIIQSLLNSDWKIVSEPTLTEWGYPAIIQDTDGRKVELKEI